MRELRSLRTPDPLGLPTGILQRARSHVRLKRVCPVALVLSAWVILFFPPAALAASLPVPSTSPGIEAAGGIGRAVSPPGDPPVYRYGLSFGGASLVAVVFEYESANRGIEFSLGTFSGRDLAVAVTGKQYLGRGSFRAFAGAGLWGVAAFPPDGRTGLALVARAPLGADWHAFEQHAIGIELSVNRALALRRPDPVDLRPPRSGFIPLPGAYYRFAPAASRH